MSTTKKNAVLYFGVKLSDNVVETPEGYLVFKGAVIARTGFQTYKFKELPSDECADQGIVAAPDDDVVVYRSADEVFSKACIASFEGKSVTDRHPDGLLDVESDLDFTRGHVQNIRKAEELLDDGNEGLLGDIIVKDPHLIAKYKAGLRELSCGYRYHLLKSGDKIFQVDIRGNHVAFVESGRAGSNVRVNDSKPTEMSKMEQNEIAFGDGIKAIAEKTDGKGVFNFFAGLFSLTGRKPAIALDAAPEANGAADAKAAKDAERARMHAALDKQLDARDSATEEQAAQDEADAEALKSIFTTPSAEHTEESGADSEREEEEEEGASDSERDEEEETEEEEEEGGADEAVESVAAPVIPAGARPESVVPSATDAAYRAGAAAMAKALKPHIARSGDKRLKGAFDTATKLATKSSFVARGGAGYGKFARAAATANDSARASLDAEQQRAKDAEAAYAQARKDMRK